MNSEGAFILMAVAVVLSSAALVVHAIASFGLYRTLKKLQEDISPLIPETRQTLQSIQTSLADATSEITEVSARSRAVLDLAHSQLQQFDATRAEFTTRFKIQAERMELVLDDTLSRVQEVVAVLQGTVLRPVREVSGVLAGVKAAVQTFMLGRRPNVAQATHDEEMFI
jgi:hypothetical protein